MKKPVLFTLAILMIFGMPGCSKVEKVSYEEEETSISATASEEEYNLTDDSGQNNASSKTSKPSSSQSRSSSVKPGTSSGKINVGELGDTKLPDYKIKGKKITYLTTDTLNETNKKLAADFKKAYGAEIVWNTSAWNELATNLSKMVLAQNAPDLVTLRSGFDFPLVGAKGLLQSYESKADLDSDLWKGAKWLIEENKYQGKNYLLISSISVGDVIWYNKNLIRNAGISKLPDQLYEEKKWDWDALVNIAKEVKDAEATAPVYGFGADYLLLANDIMCNRGASIIKIAADGKQSLNLTSPEVNEALSLYSDLYFKHKIMGPSGQELALFLANRLGMLIQGSWITQSNNKIAQMYKNGAIGMVPLPSWKGKQENHKLVVSQHAIPKGAKNVDGGLALASYLRYISIDKSTVEENRGKMISQNLLSAKEYTYLDRASSQGMIMHNLVGDTGSWYWRPYQELQAGTPWTTVVPKYQSQFQKCIDEYNELIKK